MEVLKPEVLRLGTFCYRVNPGDARGQPPSTPFDQDDLECSTYDSATDWSEDIDTRVKETANKTFTASLDIPSALYKFIIGKKGETKRKIEYDTRCQVQLPPRDRQGFVVVRGASARSVSSVLTRIDVLTESGRSKLPFTHFLSVPLNQQTVQHGFRQFMDQTIQLRCPGMDDSLFQNPTKLHLTIGTLTLLSDDEVSAAAELLHTCVDEVTRTLGDDVRLRVSGLDYMNDDPSAIDILYAKVQCTEHSDRLQAAVDGLTSVFAKAAMLNRDHDRDKVKLHLTLLNTLFRQETAGSRGSRENSVRGSRVRETFNAQSILHSLADFEFGVVSFPGFHLSKRHSATCDGYYEPVTSICTRNTAADRPEG